MRQLFNNKKRVQLPDAINEPNVIIQEKQRRQKITRRHYYISRMMLADVIIK